MVDHPSHVTRFSDSSFYDEICVLCGTTDGPGGQLAASCPIGRNLKKSHTLEVLYAPERTDRKKVRCKTCGETAADLLSAFECSNPSEEKRAHLFEDVDVMRKIEGTDGREGPSWLEAAPDHPDPEIANAEFARGGVIKSVRPEYPAILGRQIVGEAVGIEPPSVPFERKQTSDYESFKFSLDSLFRQHLEHAPRTSEVARVIEALRQTVRQMDQVLNNPLPPVVVTIGGTVGPNLSLTEKIGKLIAQEAKKGGLNLPIRHTPRQSEDRQQDRQAVLEKEAIFLAKEQIVLRAQKEKLHRDNLAKFETEDGKGPQHGTKMPDADFIPLYRSEKDA